MGRVRCKQGSGRKIHFFPWPRLPLSAVAITPGLSGDAAVNIRWRVSSDFVEKWDDLM